MCNIEPRRRASLGSFHLPRRKATFEDRDMATTLLQGLDRLAVLNTGKRTRETTQLSPNVESFDSLELSMCLIWSLLDEFSTQSHVMFRL